MLYPHTILPHYGCNVQINGPVILLSFWLFYNPVYVQKTNIHMHDLNSAPGFQSCFLSWNMVTGCFYLSLYIYIGYHVSGASYGFLTAVSWKMS